MSCPRRSQLLRNSILGLAALLMGSASALAADGPDAPAYNYLPGLQTHFDQIVQEDDRIVGLAAAVIENGEPVFVYTHGEASAGSGREVSETTLFRAASVSKTFTGTLFALLEEEGVLTLDAPVPDEVMTLSGQRRPTIEEVLSHRTGLPPNAYDNMLEEGRTLPFIRERLAGVDLLCPVGSCYTYQNVAFASVEVLAEQATGRPYDELLRSELFERLGLSSASIGTQSLEASDNWAAPHRGWRRQQNRPGDPETYYDRMPSAAGVNLSLNDM
ncbi:MAG: serine hydrolase, partial [Alphaproteobacteria bacterium]|nr:serine hydrolase [Alphaproteobacteria bacterium]